MYNFLLFLHSWGRWLVLIAAVWAIVRAYAGWKNRRPYLKADNTASVFFIAMVHSQVLIGLLLYFFASPYVSQAMSDFGGAMKNAELRYWGVEHIAMMIVAAVVAQVGRIRAKKADTPTRKHRQTFWFYLVAVLIMLLSIPWGLFNPKRPLFRFSASLNVNVTTTPPAAVAPTTTVELVG
ncbi:hypothetical protein SAMN05421823_10139 [Catalinimonas alkaloidigena]|uniref:Cytochrome B n=1 Tax=Catalinimonas alkaloidigena TaxID=1075417 RepID=A0A1G8WCW8_9BACT|nr:hypothetical protein [Catalinimonas alkaloidigena]SDJ76063.1 hypothetical protein SAMN05421823_10139 [Catalinimonas alkaloidigena]